MFSSALFLTIFFGSGYLLLHEHKKLKQTPWSAVMRYSSPRPAMVIDREPQPPASPYVQERPAPRFFLPRDIFDVEQQRPFSRWERLARLPPSAVQFQPPFVRAWKNAVRSLVQSSLAHLGDAQRQLGMGDLFGAVFSASMGVEKMSRALLHCYGIKPNVGFGQVEELRFLQSLARMDADEEFKRSVGLVEKVVEARLALDSEKQVRTPSEFLVKSFVGQLCRDAGWVVKYYRWIIEEKFAAELDLSADGES